MKKKNTSAVISTKIAVVLVLVLARVVLALVPVLLFFSPFVFFLDRALVLVLTLIFFGDGHRTKRAGEPRFLGTLQAFAITQLAQ